MTEKEKIELKMEILLDILNCFSFSFSSIGEDVLNKTKLAKKFNDYSEQKILLEIEGENNENSN